MFYNPKTDVIYFEMDERPLNEQERYEEISKKLDDIEVEIATIKHVAVTMADILEEKEVITKEERDIIKGEEESIKP
jgi:hypothetical protein